MRLEGASESQQKAFESAIAGKNIFLTGEAGSGKSWLINKIINELEKQHKRVLPEAPTGIAALELEGGTTMHRTHRIPIDIVETLSKSPVYSRVIAKADLIIIDEISMARIDVFEFAMKSIEKSNPNAQIIVVGDFCQLPPVVRNEDREMYEILKDKDMGKGYCFQSEYWTKMKFETHYLKEPMRQSEDSFIKALNEARYGDPNCIAYFNKCVGKVQDSKRNYIYLTGMNRVADEKNEEELSKLDTTQYDYPTETFGKVNRGDKAVPDVLSLKVGARVMMLKNDPDDCYSNGTIGVVERIDTSEDRVFVRFPQGYGAWVEKYTWEINKYELSDEGNLEKVVIGGYTNFPMRLAWAITIHKSQGQTFDSVILDPQCWEEGQLYVALSRVRTIEGLILTRPIQASSLKSDASVQNFYKDFRWKPKEVSDEGYDIDAYPEDEYIVVELPNEEAFLVYMPDDADWEKVVTCLESVKDTLTKKLVAQQLKWYSNKEIKMEELEDICSSQKRRAVLLAQVRKKAGTDK